MDPISTLILVAAQLGITKAVGSPVGDDVGGPVAEFLGLVVQVERAQDSLIAIERNLETPLNKISKLKFETQPDSLNVLPVGEKIHQSGVRDPGKVSEDPKEVSPPQTIRWRKYLPKGWR